MTSTQNSSFFSGDNFLIFAVIGIFVAAFIYALWWMGQNKKELESLALKQGWSYSQADQIGLKAKIEAVFPNEEFNSTNVMVDSGRPVVTYFDCGYAPKVKKRSMAFALGGVIETDRIAANQMLVEIFPRMALAEFAEPDRVEVEGKEFNEHFLVASKNAAMAKKLVGSDMKAALLKHLKEVGWKPLRVNLGSGRIVVLAGPNRGSEAFGQIGALLKELERAL